MHRQNWLILAAMVAVCCGCHPCGKNCNDIPAGAIPQPAGGYDCQWIHGEMSRADRDIFVIYQYEWTSDGAKLTPDGRAHVACIAQRLGQVAFPVVVEESPDGALNGARQAAVLDALASAHAQIDPGRVVIGRSQAEGLYSQEAAGIAAGAIRNQITGQGAGATGGAGQSGVGIGQSGAGGQTGVGIGVGVGAGLY